MSQVFHDIEKKILETLQKVPNQTPEQLSTNTELSINELNIDNNLITFKTNKPNQLHLIKVSYFPNWKITSGEGPFRISPSFMAVIPYSENVELKFKKSSIEAYSFYTAILSLLLFIGLRLKRNKFV